MTITTQEQLTEALANATPDFYLAVEIDANKSLVANDTVAGKLVVTGAGTITVSGVATVHTHNTICVIARGDVTVRAYGGTVIAHRRVAVYATDAKVEANGDVSVIARGTSRVHACNRTWVTAHDDTVVTALDSTIVVGYGNSVTHAYDRASANAYDSSVVYAEDQARVAAYGVSTVHAKDDCTVTAGPQATVYRHSPDANVTATNVIDVPSRAARQANANTWLTFHGVPVADGRATLYKAVDKNLAAGHEYNMPTQYVIGAELVCPDWEPNNYCGNGLHVSPAVHQAASYRNDPWVMGDRYLRVSVAVKDIYPIEGSGAPKCKVPRLRVEAEVDRFGRDLPTPVVVAGE